MINFLYKSFPVRIVFGLLTGALTLLLLELIFRIQYRYYIPFSHPLNYLYAAGFGIVITELVVRVNTWLDSRLPWDSRPVKRASIQFLAGTGIIVAILFVIRLVLIPLLIRQHLIILTDEITLFLLTTFLLMVFNITELGIFLNRKYRTSLADLERFKKENAEYQFEMLKLQLNPHFLFNSLNTLSSLIHEDTEKSAEFIRKLADVYRYVLDNRDRELVKLRKEMEFIASYIFLLQIRFRDMVKFVVEVEESCLEKQIAPMTLQMLVENSVKHNVASKQHPLEIRLFTKGEDVWVVNNLKEKQGTNNTGMGLKNISSRYGFLTDRKVEVTKDKEMFSVKIPLV